MIPTFFLPWPLFCFPLRFFFLAFSHSARNLLTFLSTLYPRSVFCWHIVRKPTRGVASWSFVGQWGMTARPRSWEGREKSNRDERLLVHQLYSSSSCLCFLLPWGYEATLRLMQLVTQIRRRERERERERERAESNFRHRKIFPGPCDVEKQSRGLLGGLVYVRAYVSVLEFMGENQANPPQFNRG